MHHMQRSAAPGARQQQLLRRQAPASVPRRRCCSHRPPPPPRLRCSNNNNALQRSGGGGDAAPEEEEEGEGPSPPPRLRGTVYRATARDAARAAPPTFPLDVPLLPFGEGDVLSPGGTKTLHLYESRYLAMLEEVLSAGGGGVGDDDSDDTSASTTTSGNTTIENDAAGVRAAASSAAASWAAGGGVNSCARVFAHVVVQPRGGGFESGGGNSGFNAAGDEGFSLGLATLVRVLEVRAVDVGALVRVRAEGRVAVTRLERTPAGYLRGTLAPLLDAPPAGDGAAGELRATAAELRAVMSDVQNLAAKFRGNETAALQAAMYWHDNEPLLRLVAGGDEGAERAARLSFAAMQHLPGASDKERATLIARRVEAMQTRDTGARLAAALETMKEARAVLAAKCALRSINLSA